MFFPLYFCMEQNLIPALKEESVVSSSSFQGCHPYQISEHVRNIHVSNGEKYVQTHPEFRHTVDCCHSKQKHDQELSLVCFIICGTREDGTFCPRLSNVSPDCRGTAKEKILGSHCGLRSKGCFDGQCFRSSTHDLIISNLFRLSKLKYRDTKASHIKKSLQKVTSESNWTFFWHSHSNNFQQLHRTKGRSRTAGLSPKPRQVSHGFV